jgi:hypothetical protein
MICLNRKCKSRKTVVEKLNDCCERIFGALKIVVAGLREISQLQIDELASSYKFHDILGKEELIINRFIVCIQIFILDYKKNFFFSNISLFYRQSL